MSEDSVGNFALFAPIMVKAVFYHIFEQAAYH